jgi:translation elongation factor EF-Tu-like GTPase
MKVEIMQNNLGTDVLQQIYQHHTMVQKKKHCVHLDFPGNDNTVKNTLKEASHLDIAILVVSASKICKRTCCFT